MQSIMPLIISAETLKAAQKDICGKGPVSQKAGLGGGQEIQGDLQRPFWCR